jgi:hypothetical protein
VLIYARSFPVDSGDITDRQATRVPAAVWTYKGDGVVMRAYPDRSLPGLTGTQRGVVRTKDR